MNRRAILISVVAGVGLARAAHARLLFRFRIFGNSPLTTVRGVSAAGNPWVTDNSQIRLYDDGRLRIRIRGLVLAPGVTQGGTLVPDNLVGTNPVSTVRIAITWMVPDPSNPVFIQETGPLPLDPNGDLTVDLRLTLDLPPGAERPIILVRAGATPGTGPFIASSDFVADWGDAREDRLVFDGD